MAGKFAKTLVASLLMLSGVCALAATTSAPVPQVITQEQALAAWYRFRQAPEQQLREAPTFLKFMQRGTVHTVLRSDLLFWMYQPYPQDVQAVLYAAYMGGNLDSQLRGKRQGDDAEAGISAALDAWAQLKPTHPKLDIKQLDQWAEARRKGQLASALAQRAAP